MIGSEYAKRLQDQYEKVIGSSELFSWAQVKKDEIVEEGARQEDEDPITKLLKSNKSVFNKKEVVLKPG